MRGPAEKMFSTIKVNFSPMNPKNFSQVSLIDPFQRVSPLYRQEQVHDVYTKSSPGFAETEDDTTEGVLAVKFIIGRDFAVTRPSPESC